MRSPPADLSGSTIPSGARATRWLAVVHVVGAAVCLAFPALAFARHPGHFATRLFSRSQLLEEGPLVVAAAFLLVVAVGLLRRATWVRRVAMGGYWFVTLAGTAAFLAAAILLAANQLNAPVRPFGLDIHPLAALTVAVVAPLIVAPSVVMAAYFTWKRSW
ncbi:MAG: hypothetical protein KJO43_05685 [Phycisphaerae bacterium]|nr:hypothetical protein [Phycisphaerae bacterium]